MLSLRYLQLRRLKNKRLLSKHNIQNHFVGFLHTVGTEGTYVVDGCLDVLPYYALAVIESAALARCHKGIDSGADSRCYLGGAGTLGAI